MPPAKKDETETNQGRILRTARDQLNVTTEEMARLLGVSLPTMRGWLLPKHSGAHRTMPKTAQLLLERIVADGKKGRRSKKAK